MAREVLGDYLAAVGAQIRWRRARRPLLRELSDHIADQAAAFQAQGLEEGPALERAVAEMGDPAAVGRDLDRLHRPQNRWSLALGVLFLLLAGLLLQHLSARFLQDSEADYYFRRQGFGALLSVGVLAGLWFSDCTLLLRRRRMAPAALGALLAACLAGGIGLPWLRARTLVTYLTLLMPVLYAALLCRLQGRGSGTILLSSLGALTLTLPAFGFLATSAGIVAAGTMLLVLGAAAGLGWFSGRRGKALLLAWGPTLALGALLLLRSPGFLLRLQVFLHPEGDPYGAGFQYLTLRAGELLFPGEFYGNACDYFLAFLAQALGRWVFPAAAGLLLLSAVLLLRRTARLQSRAGKLLALSALLPLLLQAGLYLLFNLGWSPLGPLSLPFLSYGMGYLAVNAALVGVLLSVFRMDRLLRDGPATDPARPRPDHWDLPLGRGTLSIQYRRGT